jgi:hypothetical protein
MAGYPSEKSVNADAEVPVAANVAARASAAMAPPFRTRVNLFSTYSNQLEAHVAARSKPLPFLTWRG